MMEDLERGTNDRGNCEEKGPQVSTCDEDPIPTINIRQDDYYHPKLSIIGRRKKSSIPTVFQKARNLQYQWQNQMLLLQKHPSFHQSGGGSSPRRNLQSPNRRSKLLSSFYGNPMFETLLRIMLILVILMKSFAQVPLSFVGVSLFDTSATAAAGNNDDDDVEPTRSNIRSIQKGYIQTSLGEVHYVCCDGTTTSSTTTSNHAPLPILCIHAFRQSSDEFREILPILAFGDGGRSKRRKVVAIDLLSHGKSDLVPSAEVYSSSTSNKLASKIADACCLEVALSIPGMDRFVTMASGTASTILAQELASRYPQRVMGVLSVVPNAAESLPSMSSPPEPLLFPSNRNVLRELFHRYETAAGDFVLEEVLKLRMFHSELTYWMNERKRLKEAPAIDENQGPMSHLESMVLASSAAIEQSSSSDTTTSSEASTSRRRMKKIGCPSLCIITDGAAINTDILHHRMAKIEVAQPPPSNTKSETNQTTTLDDLRQTIYGKQVVALCLDFLNRNSI